MQINKELFNALLEFTNDRWITVHPNGEDEKGRHLLIKDGETLGDAMSRQWGKDDGQLQLNFPGAKKAVKDAKIHENKKQVSRDKLYKALIEDKDDDASNKRIIEAEKEYEKYHEPIKYYDDFMDKYEEEKAEASRKKIRDEKYKQEAEKNKQIAEKKAKEEEAKKKEEKFAIPEAYKKDVSKYSSEQHAKAEQYYGEKMANAQRKANANINKDDNKYQEFSKQFEEYKAYTDFHKNAQAKKEEPKQEKKELAIQKEITEAKRLHPDMLNVEEYIRAKYNKEKIKEKSTLEDKKFVDNLDKEVKEKSLNELDKLKTAMIQQEPKKETPKAEASPFGEGVTVKEHDKKGMYLSSKNLKSYEKGDRFAILDDWSSEGRPRYSVKFGGKEFKAHSKTYATEKGMQKAIKEHLAGEANKETKALETKTSIEDTEKAYKEALQAKKANDEALKTHKIWSDEWMAVANKHHIAKINKAITDSRRQYAEAIMTNFEKSDNTAYEDKLQARRDRYEALSDKAQAESDAKAQRSRDMMSAIPMGQPILVGHHSEKRDRAFREKAWNTMGKSFELSKKADYYADKASSVGKAGISADDANAIAKLTAKYKSGVNSAEKRRIIDRVISIHKNAQMAKTVNPNEDYSSLGFNVERNADLNRLQLKFGDIPDASVRSVLKSNGFRWSPSNKAWQRQSGSNAEASLKRVADTLRMKTQATGSML